MAGETGQDEGRQSGPNAHSFQISGQILRLG
jgi:hypothetical protein